jgi:hypothetical protein
MLMQTFFNFLVKKVNDFPQIGEQIGEKWGFEHPVKT